MVPISVLPMLAQYPGAHMSTEKAIDWFKVCRNERTLSFLSLPSPKELVVLTKTDAKSWR